MGLFNRTLSERYSKLVKLIKSIDSHFQLTEDKEDSFRLHLPNYKGNQTMDFHIYLLEPFLYISFTTEVEGKKVSCLSNYHQNVDQQDMFNACMNSNLVQLLSVMKSNVKNIDNEKDDSLDSFNTCYLTEEQRYALFYYVDLFYHSCKKQDNKAHAVLYQLYLSRMDLDEEDILHLKAIYSHLEKKILNEAIKSIDNKAILDLFIPICVAYLNDTGSYMNIIYFEDLLHNLELTIDNVKELMKKKGLSSMNNFYERKATSAWDDVDKDDEESPIKVINFWSLLAFAKEHGKMQVGDFQNKETGEMFKACIFTNPQDGTRVFVAFSAKLGALTPKEIAAMKDNLVVVQFENGNYSLCKRNTNLEDVPL